MKHSIHSAAAFPSNLEKLETNIQKLQKTAEELHAQVGEMEDEVHRTEKDVRAVLELQIGTSLVEFRDERFDVTMHL